MTRFGAAHLVNVYINKTYLPAPPRKKKLAPVRSAKVRWRHLGKMFPIIELSDWYKEHQGLIMDYVIEHAEYERNTYYDMIIFWIEDRFDDSITWEVVCYDFDDLPLIRRMISRYLVHNLATMDRSLRTALEDFI